jgi:hypothetical protein
MLFLLSSVLYQVLSHAACYGLMPFSSISSCSIFIFTAYKAWRMVVACKSSPIMDADILFR